ncbi:helix-turn-helix domain-containing protein [Nocardioides daejeonensis]|uniref:helix-turn-helix domain-containing protein n=1 Tax=Nocardioides daejeonensis TaxID=1046556 RepID=UPI000D74B8F3|nr:XRE family transcriptional regulator [Nocardioides daejeonensis]
MDLVLTPQMLVLTREAKGWTQRDLAAKTGISQAVISKIESGATDVAGDRLTHIAEVLDCPPALLCRPIARVDTANTCLHHRRRQSKLSAAATKRIDGIAHLTRVTVEGIFDGVHAQLATDIDPVDVIAHANAAAVNAARNGSTGAGLDAGHSEREAEEGATFDPVRADAAARYLRQRWQLSGPVQNLIGLLEAHGILVVYRNLGSRAQDGVSSWPADLTQPPIIVINADLPADRVRFTLAHELAHLLLHRIPSDDAEREANRFAGEFLVPASEIAGQLDGLNTGDLVRLLRLKEEWGVSIGMLIQRARDTNHISDRQFREFRVRLAKLGWDINEPGNVSVETPTLLAKAFAIGQSQLGLTMKDLAAMAYMTPASFERHFLPAPQEQLAPRRVLNLNATSTTTPASPSSRRTPERLAATAGTDLSSTDGDNRSSGGN